MNDQANELRAKIVALAQTIKSAIKEVIGKIGAFLTKISQDGSETTAPEAPQATQKSKMDTHSPQIAQTIADEIVRRIEIDFDVINRDVTRSPQFKSAIEKIVGGKL